MAFKNHYRTLGIAPNASLEAIKKEFRKLAMQYHPDMNAGNEFAASHFRELQEAYEILSHPTRRAKYQYEWKLHFPDSHIHLTWTQTSETILNDTIHLNKQLAAMDMFRMNKELIYRRIQQILSESNMNLLQHHNHEAINEKLVQQLLAASSILPFKYFDSIKPQLKTLSGTNEELLKEIERFAKTSRYKNYWEKYYPVLVFLIAIIISWLIYRLSHSRL
ncbi:MAG TPA: DnaJ domain-containing protein [Agriterribacter sp.]|nr:DnaJ domain-containing protein [Agriterribacter sp.]